MKFGRNKPLNEYNKMKGGVSHDENCHAQRWAGDNQGRL